MLDNLVRCTHRTAIGNKSKHSKALDDAEFITRLLRHVLPSSFTRVRHHGLLALAHQTERMAAARQLLAMPQTNPVAIEDANWVRTGECPDRNHVPKLTLPSSHPAARHHRLALRSNKVYPPPCTTCLFDLLCAGGR